MSDEVVITDRDGVRWIALDRPASRNALTVDVNAALIDAVAAVDGRDDLRAVVIAGRGGSFCSGVDLKAAATAGPPSLERVGNELRTYFHGVIRAVRGARVPTVAAVDGPAVGFGCDLALACDVRIASERARFGEVFVARGLMPDGGGTYALPRVVGLGRALELLYTGERIGADEAYRIGLANRVIPTDRFDAAVWEFAARLAKGPPLACRLIKQAVYASLGGDLDSALEREATGQLECLASADFAEGMAAFFGKREPKFRGK